MISEHLLKPFSRNNESCPIPFTHLIPTWFRTWSIASVPTRLTTSHLAQVYLSSSYGFKLLDIYSRVRYSIYVMLWPKTLVTIRREASGIHLLIRSGESFVGYSNAFGHFNLYPIIPGLHLLGDVCLRCQSISLHDQDDLNTSSQRNIALKLQ